MIDWDKEVLTGVHEQFGEPVDYTNLNGPTTTVLAVFDDAYHEVDPVTGIPAATATPMLGVRQSQLPIPPKQGDTVRIHRTGATYTVRNPRPDSHGEVRCVLGGKT